MRLKFLFAFILLVSSSQLFANDSDDQSAKDTIDNRLNRLDAPPYLSVHVGFLSKVTYAGRYYGDNGVGLYPTVIYKHKSGFEVNFANILWTGFTPTLVETDLTAGYSKNLTSWSGIAASYSRTFMYYGTDSDRRAMNNSVSLGLSLYPNLFNASIEYSYMFGYDKASALHAEINKDFSFYKFLGSEKFTLTPKIETYVGQQTVLYHFFSKKAVKQVNQGKSLIHGKGKKSAGSTTTTTTTTVTTENTETGTAFQVMDYEAALSANYRKGHITFEVTFYTSIPQNLPVDYAYGKAALFYVNSYLKYTF